MADQADDRGDFGPTWLLVRPLPESDAHPGTPTARMKRALKGLLRGYGIAVEKIQAAAPPEDATVTEFADGPAAGVVLMLRRAPLYLRVTFDRRARMDPWDALDALDDVPKPGEDLIAYRRVGLRGSVFVRPGGRFALARYAAVDPQPDDRTMRAVDPWRAWCQAQAAGPEPA